MNTEKTKNNKIIKRIIISFVVVVFVLFLTNFFSYRNSIFRLVKGNTELLNHSVYSGLYDEAYKLRGVKDISKYTTSDGNLLIDYFCYGFGLVPSSVYYGFYYSGDGNPAGFQGVDFVLVEDENGWIWSQKDGDNWYYTEHIVDNWYFYKAGF